MFQHSDYQFPWLSVPIVNLWLKCLQSQKDVVIFLKKIFRSLENPPTMPPKSQKNVFFVLPPSPTLKIRYLKINYFSCKRIKMYNKEFFCTRWVQFHIIYIYPSSNWLTTGVFDINYFRDQNYEGKKCVFSILWIGCTSLCNVSICTCYDGNVFVNTQLLLKLSTHITRKGLGV